MLRPLFILLAAGLFAGCDGKTFVQKAKSMSPTIRADETVRVDMEAYKNTAPQRLDIVLFHPPEEAAAEVKADDVWVFRIIGVPGDEIKIEGGALFVNSRRAGYQSGSSKSIYPPSAVERDGKPSYPLTVPEGTYFVCGDSPNANDSRQWGVLDAGRVIGKVVGKE